MRHVRLALITALLPIAAAVAQSQQDTALGEPTDAAQAPPEAAAAEVEVPVDPEAQQVLQRAVEAIGGAQTRQAVVSTRSVARLEIPGATSNFQLLTRSPNLFLVRHEIDGLGQMELGFDGSHAWRRDPPDGMLTEMTAANALEFSRQFDLQALFREIDLRFTEARMAEPAQIEGVECDVILMKNGEQAVTVFFDRASGLPKAIQLDRDRVVAIKWSEQKTPLRWVREFRIEQRRDQFRAIYDMVSFDDVSESTFIAPPSLTVDAGGADD